MVTTILLTKIKPSKRSFCFALPSEVPIVGSNALFQVNPLVLPRTAPSGHTRKPFMRQLTLYKKFGRSCSLKESGFMLRRTVTRSAQLRTSDHASSINAEDYMPYSYDTYYFLQCLCVCVTRLTWGRCRASGETPTSRAGTRGIGRQRSSGRPGT
jgi:hypothetical protein